MPDLIPDPRPDRVAVAQVIAEAAYEERVDRCVRRRDIPLVVHVRLDALLHQGHNEAVWQGVAAGLPLRETHGGPR